MRISNILSKLTLFLVLVVVATACDNSVAGDDHDHEHADAEGFRLVLNGQTIVEQLPDQDLTGEIDLAIGEETDLIRIQFIDHDGDYFTPDGDEYSLGYQFEDQGLVEFEQHAEDGKWEFHLHAGQNAGHTDLTLMVMHNDHSDFTTQAIHVHVE